MEVMPLVTALMNNGEYGWIGVITALLTVIAGAVMFISKALLVALKNIRALKKEIRPDVFMAQVYCEADVSLLLKTVRHDTHADRVLLFQYHNGVHSIVNNSLWKVSVSHESLGPNVPSTLSHSERWPFNYLGKFNKIVADNETVIVDCIETAYRDPENADVRGILDQLRTEGVKSIYMFPLVNSLGVTFGIGMLQYIREPVKLEEDWLFWAKDRFRAVGILLAGSGDPYDR